MIDRSRLHSASDRDGLLRLLAEDLGWPVDLDLPLFHEPEISAGIKGGVGVEVHSLVPLTEDDRWLIVLAEFEQNYVRRDLRELLASLRRYMRTTDRFHETSGYGDTIFIVVTPGYRDVRFVLFEERERRLPRIRSFGWDRKFIGRTVLTHNLERLRWSDRDSWEGAWDVEELTEEFYIEFVKVFDAVKAATWHPGDEEKRHAYVQQLLDRLLFIAFIERMGWLRTPDWNSDYLHAQWLRFNNRDSYATAPDKALIPATFNGLLGELFFRALDNVKGIGLNDPLYPILGEVPYLNGGLFSEEADLDVSGVTVADEVFDLILGDSRPGFEGGLFRRFNFTVTESTPLDQEVAVDPEMLGKIFERLIIKAERHQTGAYYTPRPIVEFMVNEALKGYLTERGLPADKAALLVDEDRVESDDLSFRPSEMQDTLDWLFEVRAVDPACGSGAYLLMLLQRLFELVDRLEVVQNKRRNPDQKHLYNTKLRLLERCVYGVDISEIAVRIARLRLWLSLVVENRGEKPEPLPNFDFLIMCGDSLASPVKPDQHPLGYPHDAIREYTRLKRLYFHPKPGQTRPTREEMQAKRAEIAEAFQDDLASSRLRSLSKNPFDWEVEFAEVFDPDDPEETLDGRLNLGLTAGRHGQGELAASATRPPGFDIVLANPPFVNSGELLKSVGRDYKDALVASFRDTGTGTTDLLIFFMDRALQLLRPGGHLSFITSNKWLKAAYGLKLRAHLATVAAVKALIDFRDLPVFQGTIAYPLITVAQKRSRPLNGSTTRQEQTCMTSIDTLDPPFPDVAELVRVHGKPLAPDALDVNGNWRLETSASADRTTRLRPCGRPLRDYIGSQVYKGVETGLNRAFLISEAQHRLLIEEDPASAEILRPVLTPEAVGRWHVKGPENWIIYSDWETDIARYPAIEAHLRAWEPQLRSRPDVMAGRYNWWCLRRFGGDNARHYNKIKILFPDISAEAQFGLDTLGITPLNTLYFLSTNDLYLLGVLNSSSALYIYRGLSNQIRGGYMRYIRMYVEALPVPTASDTDRSDVEVLVQQILDRKASDPDADVSALEAEIDRRVDFLYFHADEAPTYGEWVARREAEKGTVVEEIRKLIAIGHETDGHEYKSSFAWDVRKNERGDYLKDEVHTAICAFLNARGGEVLIGVDDDGNVLGLEKDLSRYSSKDKLVQAIEAVFGNKLAPNPIGLVRIGFVEIDGKTICRVRVQGDRAAMYKFNGSIYVRRNSGSKPALTAEEAAYWWPRRQRGEA